MFEFLKTLDPVSRRSALELAAKSMLGVTVFPAASALAAPAKKAKSAPKAGGGTAKNVIYLFMTGAMTHLDTFDLKPGREVQGETKGIKTNVSGMQISEYLPKLAKLTDKLAIIRSLATETGDHEQGRYLMRTSYKQIASIRHPGLGAWAMKLQGRRNQTLPDNVTISVEPRHPGAGFLEPSFSPVPIGDPNSGLQNTKSPAYLTDDSLSRRLELIDTFDASFRKRFRQKQVEAYNEFYRQAVKLMSSDDLKAFNLGEEKAEVRDQYGRDRFGQGCLLARRLVENKVRFVEVALDGWDHHTEIYDKVPKKAEVLDQALSALLTDLEKKGLLKETLVVVATEFGRTPKINQNSGRDHHPGAFSGVLAGGGIKGGRFHGTSDKDGFRPDEDPVTVSEFNATIAYAMGLPLDEEVHSKSGRPFKVGNGGDPLTVLF